MFHQRDPHTLWQIIYFGYLFTKQKALIVYILTKFRHSRQEASHTILMNLCRDV